MLFKTLGYTTSIGNLVTIFMMVDNGIIQKIGTAHWTIGIGSVLLLSLISVTFFYLNNEKEGISSLKLYSYVYTGLSVLLFSYTSIKNLFNELRFDSLISHLSILVLLSFIALFTTVLSKEKRDKKYLIGLSSALSMLSLLITFGTIYKYIFLQMPVTFEGLSTELLMIFLGNLMFVSTYIYAQKN